MNAQNHETKTELTFMRRLIVARLPKLSQKLRVVRNLTFRILGKIKRALISFGSWIFYFCNILTLRDARLKFIQVSQPKLTPVEFLQGLRTSYSPRSIWRWHRISNIPILVVRICDPGGTPTSEEFQVKISKLIRGDLITISQQNFARLGSIVLEKYPKHDVFIVDGTEPDIDLNNLILLKHAAYKYNGHQKISVVTGGHQTSSGENWTIFANRSNNNWEIWSSSGVKDYRQFEVPRYVFAAEFHGTYIKNEAVRNYLFESKEPNTTRIFNSWLEHVIGSGQRILEYSPAKFIAEKPDISIYPDLSWLMNRNVFDSSGLGLPIIFVLPATSMSGGIRAVLEKAEALIALGEEVEVWSLQGNPTWTEISFDVRKFDSYSDITDALSTRNALKVATWWETAEPVLLGSMKHGIPIQYVQEFESWFYPTSEAARAAVVSSYRPEFFFTTTASFQRDELAEIGINSPIIPPAFDSKVFFDSTEVVREENTLLALGRSFFQKNFQQTLNAWKRLGEYRPHLQLFGFEPELVQDERASYAVKPSDTEIADLYRRSSIFIQTSIHEGFSLPIIEAMACGCPVITTDSHGNRDFCIDGENCIIVEQGDIVGTSQAINDLLNRPDEREKLSKAGIETAKRYSWNRVALETAKQYRKYAMWSIKQ